MKEIFERTESLLGAAAMEKLAHAHVAVFGLGGVGGYVAEALTRAGVGELTLIDDDTVSLTNCNRQIFATQLTLGQNKTEAACARLRSINPDVLLHPLTLRFTPTTELDFSAFTFVADAVDDTEAKTEIILRAHTCGVGVVSSMGTGNKTDASRLQLTDVSRTHDCPLARSMRARLRKNGIESGVTVVFSDEPPLVRTAPPSTLVTVPAVAGLLMAQHIIKEIIK